MRSILIMLINALSRCVNLQKKQILADIMFHMSEMHSSGQLRVFPINLFGLLACMRMTEFFQSYCTCKVCHIVVAGN
jgi:hypothetical protein